jgi:hypothetical protein
MKSETRVKAVVVPMYSLVERSGRQKAGQTLEWVDDRRYPGSR